MESTRTEGSSSLSLAEEAPVNGGAKAVRLSEILVGDLVTPHGPNDPFEYDGTVLVLDDVLVRVDLPGLLGGFPANPSRAFLSAEELSSLREASEPASPVVDLLSSLDGDTLIPSGERGLSNLMAFVATHDPGLLGEGGSGEWSSPGADSRSSESSPVLVVIVLVLLVTLLAAGAWVAVRVVSGY